MQYNCIANTVAVSLKDTYMKAGPVELRDASADVVVDLGTKGYKGTVKGKIGIDFISEQGANASRAVLRHPQLLGLSIEAKLRPTVRYLASIGVDVGRAINGHPALLSLSLDGKLRPTVAYLQEAGLQEIGRALSSQVRRRACARGAAGIALTATLRAAALASVRRHLAPLTCGFFRQLCKHLFRSRHLEL